MKKRILSVILIATMAISITGCSEATKRTMKSFKSEHGGGLNRTVTVYDYNGNPIDSWTGKFDVSEDENSVFFDMDGKRVIISGGIVVNEEQ